MVVEKTENFISSVPLSNNIVCNRIQDLLYDVKGTIISCFIRMKFSFRLAKLTVFMTFVQYKYLSYFHEDIFFCKPLPFSISGNEIFSLLDAFFHRKLDTMGELY